jgi:1-acyl-sn-glycerol-3-phosphate acyltransferase
VADAEIIPLGSRGRGGRGKRDGSAAPAEERAEPVAEPVGPADEPARVPADDLDAPPADRDAPKPTASQPPSAPEQEPPASTTAGDRPPFPLAELVAAATAAAQKVFGDDADRRLAELLAFARRRLTGDYEVDEYGLDPEVTDRFLLELVRPLATSWFRVEVRGVENIPAEGGALVVSNHSGTIPLDGLVTMFAVHEMTGRHLRPLGADLIFRLPFVGELARKAGATLACNEDATRMLRGGELAGVWPEGFKGIGKPFSERYKLQRFGRGGFVSAAIRTGVPIVPCSIVGAEEIYPLVGNIPVLARLLGVPYIPVTPFFPLLGPLGLVPLPSKWIIEFGEPIRTDTYDEGAAEDPMLVFNVTDQVRETIQQTLYALLMRRSSVFH